jgi:hypothetical protein
VADIGIPIAVAPDLPERLLPEPSPQTDSVSESPWQSYKNELNCKTTHAINIGTSMSSHRLYIQ